MSLTPVPEANSAPPVEPWMAALTVSDEVMLIAGYAKPSAFARSSIWAYTSGVAMGMVVLRRSWAACCGKYPACSPATRGVYRPSTPSEQARGNTQAPVGGWSGNPSQGGDDAEG